MRNTVTVQVLLVSMLMAAVLAVPVEGVAAASTHGVRIEGIDFHPHVLTVRRGDVVSWSWHDGSTPHNVKSTGALRFRSSPTKTRGTYSVRFTRRGTYRYVCTIHFNMKSRIVVK
jgi:plastocyanin